MFLPFLSTYVTNNHYILAIMVLVSFHMLLQLYICIFAALAEASVIVREHAPLTNLFMCLWFNEVTRFTARDQLSFPYVLRRLALLHIHMFPVCTRKALVNSLGHVRKAKPVSL